MHGTQVPSLVGAGSPHTTELLSPRAAATEDRATERLCTAQKRCTYNDGPERNRRLPDAANK